MRQILSTLAAGAVALGLAATAQAAPVAGGLLTEGVKSAIDQGQSDVQQVHWRNRGHRYQRYNGYNNRSQRYYYRSYRYGNAYGGHRGRYYGYQRPYRNHWFGFSIH